jgi:hypothetical protein
MLSWMKNTQCFPLRKSLMLHFNVSTNISHTKFGDDCIFFFCHGGHLRDIRVESYRVGIHTSINLLISLLIVPLHVLIRHFYSNVGATDACTNNRRCF